MSVITYAIRSPDGKQQCVKTDLLNTLRFLFKSPDNWYVEEFFDGTISRGTPFVAEPDSREAIHQAIVLLEQPATPDGDTRLLALRLLLRKLGDAARAYWTRRSEEALALGFTSVDQMFEHQRWLDQNGSKEYKQWRANLAR